MTTSAEIAHVDLSNLEFKVQLITSESGSRKNSNKEFGDDDDDDMDPDEDDFNEEEYYDNLGESYNDYDPWLNIYYIEIVTKDTGKKIGRFGVRTVDTSARSLIGDDNLPWRLIVSVRGGSDLECFGTTLFNKANQGRLRKGFLSGPTMGTGVFGEELNVGSFAFISGDHQYARDDFFIKPEFRGQGVGSWALQKLRGHRILYGMDFLFVEPGPTDITYQQRSDVALVRAKYTRVVRFYQKAGFRRVGTDTYFGYALRNPEHPSRRLAIEDDPVEPI